MNHTSTASLRPSNSLTEQLRRAVVEKIKAGVSKKIIATNAYPLQPFAMEHFNKFLNGKKAISLMVADRIIDALRLSVTVDTGEDAESDDSDSDPNPEF